MSIKFSDEDALEVKRALESARQEGQEPEKKQPRQKTAKSEANVGRNISQIINSIRSIARSLSLRSREIFAQEISRNRILKEKLGYVIWPDAISLGIEKIWLQKIQELVDKICEGINKAGYGNAEVEKVLLLVEKVLYDLKETET